MYLRYRYRSRLGWFFWFGPIHVTICRNLASANIHYRYRVNHHIADLGRDVFDLGFIWSILLGQMGFQQT